VTAPPRLDEFARIARFFAPLAGVGALGLRDDVALIDGPPGTQYVLKTDAIVEGVHYLPDDPPMQVAQKLLRVNLSDLAAKGAAPLGYLLTTALPPSHDEAWLEQFSKGLAADQAAYGIFLLGGDTVMTPGPATLSVAAIGTVAAGRAVLRSGARAGDIVHVSGTIGDAALGVLAAKGQELGIGAAEKAFLVDRFRLPQPRLNLGARLAGLASAMMDISDGLAADFGHLCAASGLGGVIEAARVPLSPAAQAALARDPARLATVLGGGDDYELLFTAPAEAAEKIRALSAGLGLPITAIGRVEPGEGVRLLDAAGRAITVEAAGYRHF
jgi:thiamine-monophosphate kinase